MIPYEHAILLSALLFAIGAAGTIVRRNLIVVLMSVEIMLNAVNLAFITFNRIHALNPNGVGTAIDGQIFVLMILTVAAAQVAVGLALVIALVRNRDSMNIDDLNLLRW